MATNASINCSLLHKLLSTVAGGAVGVISNWKSGTLNIYMDERKREIEGRDNTEYQELLPIFSQCFVVC